MPPGKLVLGLRVAKQILINGAAWGPVFREGSKAAQVCTLLARPQGATLNEIRDHTGWQAHTVRGFISRNLAKQGRKVRSFEREGERVYRLKS
jgi:hypothetical protein